VGFNDFLTATIDARREPHDAGRNTTLTTARRPPKPSPTPSAPVLRTSTMRIAAPAAYDRPARHRTTLVWDANGNRNGTIDVLGNRFTTLFNGAQQPIATSTPFRTAHSMVYDATGNTIAEINALGFRTTSTFDSLGSFECVRNCLGAITTYVRDMVNQLVGRSDPLSAGGTTQVSMPTAWWSARSTRWRSAIRLSTTA